MKSVFERLNLRPHEQRFVVIVSAIVFVVLNLWFVWPHFKDLGGAQRKLGTSRKTQQTHKGEIQRIPAYRETLEQLKIEGSQVLSADQAIHFRRSVEELARTNGVDINSVGPVMPVRGNVNTNYFEERSMQIRVTTGESQLVDFLYTLGTGGSMIRVRDMQISPGPADSRAGGSTNLMVGLSLVGSYQRAARAPVTKAATKTNTLSSAERKL